MKYRRFWSEAVVFVGGFLAVSICGLCHADPVVESVHIENVKLRQIEAEKFTRISEFFTGEENTGRRVFLRSQPENRGGLYFITRIDRMLRELPPVLVVGVEYFEEGSARMRSHRFMLPEKRKATNKLFIGITDDGMLQKSLPVAWRVYFELEDGTLYSELKSYLWEMPSTAASGE